MQIIIYSKILKKISGVQTFEKNFIKTFKDKYTLSYVYDVAEYGYNFIEGVNYVQNHGVDLTADICIWSSINHNCPNIKANRYIQVYHTDPKLWPVIWPKKDKVDVHVAVGESVQKSLKENYSIDAIHIPNILNTEHCGKCLRLITASRIAIGKGFDRMEVLAAKLTKLNIPFTWEIYGTGDMLFMDQTRKAFEKYPSVIFREVVEDARPYIKGMDYLVQLSNNEGFCYAIYEALSLGIGVIATPFDEAVKRQHDDNVWITGFDMENVDSEWLNSLIEYNNKPKILKSYNNAKDEWQEILI
jgi:glycosyltransferase involved in cell wall biosynthesis